jgi:hypothetical protein
MGIIIQKYNSGPLRFIVKCFLTGLTRFVEYPNSCEGKKFCGNLFENSLLFEFFCLSFQYSGNFLGNFLGNVL